MAATLSALDAASRFSDDVLISMIGLLLGSATNQRSAPVIRVVGSQAQLVRGLCEQSFRSFAMSSQAASIRSLCPFDRIVRICDGLLCGTQIWMSAADVDQWSLCKD
ncbi:MAG TPA: hypothetical protein VMD58_11920 [Acidobacteriaceae bacterium]|nr:hypothetical protein [Acidobacteriaceae bacterium]